MVAAIKIQAIAAIIELTNVALNHPYLRALDLLFKDALLALLPFILNKIALLHFINLIANHDIIIQN